MECPTCRFMVSPGEIQEGACQVCGTDLRPERDQPGGSVSDGRLFNMKEPGYGQDMGGNPLQEGILGDWQNRDVRDESFASVHAKLADFGDPFGVAPREAPAPRGYEEGDEVYRTQGPGQHVPLEVEMVDSLPDGSKQYLVNGMWYHDDELSSFPDVEHAVRALDPQNLTPEMFQHPDNFMDNEPGTLYPPRAGVYRKDSTIDDWNLARSDVDLPFWHRTAAVGVAQLHPNGIHNGVAALLGFLQPKINGLDVRTNGREIVNQYSPFRDLTGQTPGWQEFLAQNPTVQVETLYDEYLPVVQDIIQNEGQPSRVPESLKELARQMHAGAVPFPPGIRPEQVKIANFEKEANPALLLRAAPMLLRGAGAAGKKVLPGALKGIAKKAPGAIGRAAIYHQIGQALFGQAPGAAGQLPSIPTQPRTYQQIAHSVHAEIQTPMSLDEIGVQADDPQQVDPHELNDGDTSGYRTDVNDIGGTGDPSPEFGDQNFTTGDDHFDAFLDAVPKLLHYYESDESGLEDPDIRALIERMDAADPEWQNSTEDWDSILSHTAALPLNALPTPVPTGNPMPGVQQVPGQTSPDGGVNGTCNVCGAGLNADGTCPAGHQGGAGVRQALPNMPGTPAMQQVIQPVAKTAINDHQGPKNAEQFSAVADLLMEQGREQEIPGMLKEPWKYAEELAQVQMKPNMPPEDLSQPEQAPNADPGAAPMPVPQPQAMPLASVTAALTRVGADSIAPRCPECDSATTGVLDSDGTCRCHRCNNVWTPEGAHKEKVQAAYREATPRVEAPSHDDLHLDPGVPAADQQGQEDLREDTDTGRTWTTSDGEALRVGETYELHSEQFSIPDLVQVEAIKPDAVNLKFIGEYSDRESPDNQLAYEHEISREEAELGAYSFQPTQVSERDQDSELGEEDQAVDPTSAPGDQTDLSSPHERMTKTLAAAGDLGMTKLVEALVRKGHGLKEATTMAKEVLSVYPGYTPDQHTNHDDYWKPLVGQPADPNRQRAIEQGGQVENAIINEGQSWRPGSEPGRGVLATDGSIHVWPESHGTHAQWLQSTGVQPEAMFTVHPDGTIQPYSFEGATEFSPTQEQAILTSNPAFRAPEVLDTGGDVFNFASAPDSHDKAMAEFEQDHGDPDLDWLKGGSVDEAPEGSDPNDELAWLKAGGFEERTAGKRYTPSQQRDFIDEEGEARNRDKLQLEGTHYTGYDAAPEDHPGLFL